MLIFLPLDPRVYIPNDWRFCEVTSKALGSVEMAIFKSFEKAQNIMEKSTSYQNVDMHVFRIENAYFNIV